MNVSWKDGKLESLSVIMGFEPRANLEWEGKAFTAEGKPGQLVQFDV